MLFYILLAIFVSFFLAIDFFYTSKFKIIQWLVVLVLIAVAGFREHVGIDYDAYIDWYNNKTRDDKLEFGFVFLMNFFRSLKISYFYFFFFFSLSTILLAFLAIKNYTNNSGIALLFFFFIPELYLCSFNLIRQSFSVCICFYAFHFLTNKKYLLFSILIFLATSIHYSAFLALIIFILIYNFSSVFSSKLIGVMLIASVIISYLNVIDSFAWIFKNSRYSYYFDSKRTVVSLFKIIVLNGVAFFVLYHFEKINDKYQKNKLILISYFFTVIFMNLFMNFSNLERLTYFFKIFEVVIIADLIFIFTKKQSLFVFFCFLIYFSSAFFHTLNKDLNFKGSSKLIPYKTVFSKNKQLLFKAKINIK